MYILRATVFFHRIKMGVQFISL